MKRWRIHAREPSLTALTLLPERASALARSAAVRESLLLAIAALVATWALAGFYASLGPSVVDAALAGAFPGRDDPVRHRFRGAVRSVVPLGAAHERGVLSVVFVVSYLGRGVPAVLAGFLVVHSGGALFDTAREFGVVVMSLAALALAGTRWPSASTLIVAGGEQRRTRLQRGGGTGRDVRSLGFRRWRNALRGCEARAGRSTDRGVMRLRAVLTRLGAAPMPVGLAAGLRRCRVRR